ncbi:DUF3237 domain-containing protein [Pseudomonas sp. PDM11]|uniref:DUF3237 domain-containing protein n=1 Tax=Pseudomonas sp. PDM11 TaxID=2769309 RepID=UPI00177EEED9|nr:DUF3237 domain-containing protein [Pseudomonas sp. PDM11]MBD9399413.1 DUF3237 domain-containing protein [Pseudomonas sp. PDM11]
MSRLTQLMALLLCLASSLANADVNTPPPLKLEPLARFTVNLEAPVWELGAVGPQGQRRIIPITSGHFDGPGFKGKILDNGADWQLVDSNGLAIIDTRYLLQTDDGALIYLQTKGFRHGPAEVLRKVAKGEPVDPSQYYFRITMQFETSDPRYNWLNGMVGVGSAMRLQKMVIYDGFIVK